MRIDARVSWPKPLVRLRFYAAGTEPRMATHTMFAADAAAVAPPFVPARIGCDHEFLREKKLRVASCETCGQWFYVEVEKITFLVIGLDGDWGNTN